MMLIGFGGLGAAIRSRRTRVAAAPESRSRNIKARWR